MRRQTETAMRHRYVHVTNTCAIAALLLIFVHATARGQVWDLYHQNKTPDYFEIIEFYETVATESPIAAIQTYGTTGAGYPLHLFIIDRDGDFDPSIARAKGKTILLINNGIHPGEPDGIDACMQLVRNILSGNSHNMDLSHVVICIIPVYNVDGCLNRNSISRVNQNGPEEYGFRGNAQNLDLNRDFIKCDSKNAAAFTALFRKWDPDLFVDTHVSNGADYQYVMTLLATQHNKLTPPLDTFLNDKVLPYLYDAMQQDGYPICPYVNPIYDIPDSGIATFLETPRYSTGYAALFNTIGFMAETHMLKPYPQRVEATLLLLQNLVAFAALHYREILAVRKAANAKISEADSLPLRWRIDFNQKETFVFSGYAAKYKPSEVTGAMRLWYDRNTPYTKPVNYYNTCYPTLTVSLPDYYILPKAWSDVADRLQSNCITMIPVERDTTLEVETYYIDSYKTVEAPYEGHYLHYDVEVHTEHATVRLYAGDWLIPLAQGAKRYIVETLEPQSPDAFFNWNFFDAVLSRKEWYSDYVFEDVAAGLLQSDEALRTAFEMKKQNDPVFAGNPDLQLEFIFEHSAYREVTYKRYPVFRYSGTWK